jgi:archaellum component FlaF (FlaF/FlaG flagellin family)
LKGRRKSRRWWSRRGISTVVANMMMIGITLSLGAILIAWAGQSYGAFSGGSQLFYQQREQALQENFVIEEVFFEKNTTGQIFVFVRNVGLININVVAIYANGAPIASTSLNIATCPFSGTPPSASIPVGVVCEFSWQPPLWTSGFTFLIVVASQRGNQVASTWRAP